jgi:hypothetical protein
MGVLARQVSLEIIPVGLLVGYAGLFGCYALAVTNQKTETSASAYGEHVV